MDISLKLKLIYNDVTKNKGLSAVSFCCRNQLLTCEFEDRCGVKFLHV